MRLDDLRRTSAFRLTLLFSALLIGSVLLVFELTYWQASSLLMERLDHSLVHESDELRLTPEAEQIAEINVLVGSDPHGDWLAGLFAADHHRLAGNVDGWPSHTRVDGVVRTPREGLDSFPGSARHELRVLAEALPDGRLLLIAHRANDVDAVRTVILRAMSVGLVASVLLALVGGLLTSFASLRRIETMRRATMAIVTGDLSLRLPTTGKGDDFDKMAQMVNVMLADIQRLIADIKSAGDNIAHDLRTPLTRLRTRLEGALRRGGDVTPHRAAMADAIQDTDQLLTTFRALLRISEVEAGERRAGFRTVDLVALAGAAAELFEPIASQRRQHLISNFAANASLHGDPDLLFEAVANLLDNAVKYAPMGGVIRLDVTSDAQITVQDNGPGLPGDLQENLFKRFTRGDKARHTPGNGLGLSLVAAVAKLHGLTLAVEDAMPGCRVRIGG